MTPASGTDAVPGTDAGADRSAGTEQSPPRRRDRLRDRWTTASPAAHRRTLWAVRTVLAALAGLAMFSAFPPRNWWFMAVVSLGLLYGLLAEGRPRARTGAWIGFVYGLGFFVSLLPWIGVYVGPLPWLALAAALAAYLALFGVCATLTMRLPVPPIWFALSWVLIEGLRSSFPFGGFPWGRTAFSQVDGPLLPLASVLGAPGVSGAVALFGASVVWVIQLAARRDTAVGMGPRSSVVRGAALGIVLALLAPVSAIALLPDTVDRNVSGASAQIAAVQGNVPRLGLEFNAQRRAVLDNHVRETMALADEINAGHIEQPSFVAWPENASDIDPLDNPDAAAEITAASDAVGAPILVGTLIVEPDGRPTNTVLVWDGSRGPIARYDKHIIQPFGEYLPWRPFFRMFSSYADMAGNFRPGTGPSVLTVPGRSGDVTVGVTTCWEVAFDRAARDAVDQGAQILYVPTNNATFGRTNMTYQQLAMSQFRAVEHGRAVIVAATSGVSALIEPDGSMTSESDIFTPAILADRLPLSSATTIATRLGAWPERIAMLLAVVALLVAVAMRTRFTQRFTAVRPHKGAGTAPEKSEEYTGDEQ
ncbi:apolipoprotein N-acyltransferase [Gordonia polyisoprenivorans]|uniref:apolipoprotein N-acyltransferase n=1 Tax=Gordonia polyisoprenivorans TaxID=84595 RepID=UPI0023014A86|nr:apolipoprotein N-acyltransferase [Gordonia polyisoprenivorans]WCB39568.1 apolipoprotein N-acyltransferase [Gordonia polyisoprenivorans]